MKLAKVFLGLVVIALFTLFATANLDVVTFRLFIRDFNVRLFMVVYASFGLGFIVAWFLSAQMIRMHKKELKNCQKQFEVLLKERDELRNLPLNTTSEPNTVTDDSQQKK
jgi:uncharacterized membrane protein YciS (DUF1049 family)